MRLSVKAYSDKTNPEFQKHFKAVEFCVEHGLSFPKETTEFFKGKIDGGDLEDIIPEYIVGYIENGIEVPMQCTTTRDETRINVKDIPNEVVEIVIKIID